MPDIEGMRRLIAAVDGCKGGWVVAQGALGEAADGPADSLPNLAQSSHLEQSFEFALCKEFSDVLDVTQHCDLVLVDMPIGLSDGGDSGDWPRQCDVLAKDGLKGKRSSLFLAPPRGCLNAENPKTFQASHRRLTGVGASLPVWGIVPKIIEVDRLMDSQVQRRVHEFHPELAWCRLAGAALPKKRSAEGRSSRWDLMGRWIDERSRNQARQWRGENARDVAEDDLLDALVGLVVCLTFGQFRLSGMPQQDSNGLLMEIVY